MKPYRFGYVDVVNGWTRVFECNAYDLNGAFYLFGTEMEIRHGRNAHERLILLEVLENGVSVNW